MIERNEQDVKQTEEFLHRQEERLLWEKNGNEVLKTVLYLLMRDKLPTSDVVEVINNATANKGRRVFSAEPLAEYAEKLANRILK